MRTSASTARLIIEDDGPGIDPDGLDRIFDRFWRHDASRTRSTGGAGLGLAIVAAIVPRTEGRSWPPTELIVGTSSPSSYRPQQLTRPARLADSAMSHNTRI